MGQKTPSPRAASTVHFSMDDDDGDVLAARPTPLVEVPPQPGVLRHTAAHIVDILPYVQILDVPVPQLGDQVVELLQEIDAPALVEQVIAVPKISLDRIPQRCPRRRPWRAEQLVEVPSRSSTFLLTVVAIRAVGEGRGVFKFYVLDRIQQRFVDHITLTFQFRVLEVFTDRFLLLHHRTHLVPWMRFYRVFSHCTPK